MIFDREPLVRCVLISGVTGHLGRQLAKRLVGAGIETHGVTRQDATPIDRHDTVIHHRIDGSTEDLLSIVDQVRPDTIFHTAALARREHQRGDIAPFVQANITLGCQLLEAMRWSGCRHFVTAGSYLQHFDTDGFRSLNLYAATKQAFEAVLEYYADAYDFAGLRLTLSDIYSEHDRRPKLMTEIASAWAAKRPVGLQMDEAWVDLIHVDDAAAAFLQAGQLLEENVAYRGTVHRYSVTSGHDVSATELVDLFERLGGRKLGIKRAVGNSAARRMKPWRGTVLPGWTAKVSLEEGIKRIIASRVGSNPAS
jgi:nucleoside-diphosphate-sugar epimerase